MKRRALLSAAGAGLLGGCSSLPLSGPTEIEPEEPNDDGSASLGEVRYLLESNDVDEYEQLSVSSMVRDGDEIQVTYASDAAHAAEFANEIGTIAAVYGIYVDRGGDTDRIVVDVETSYENQPEQFHVTTDWVRQYNAGNMSARELVNEVLSAADFPEGAGWTNGSTNASTNGSTTDSG